MRALQSGAGPVLEILVRERTARLVLRSLALAAVVTGACLVIGVSLAWLTVRARLPGRRWWMLLAAMPLAVPTYVAPSPGSPPSRAARLRGRGRWCSPLCSYPYVYLPVAAALRGWTPRWRRWRARSAASPLATFARSRCARCARRPRAAALLVALYVLSDFGAVSLMRYDAFTRVIYTSYGPPSTGPRPPCSAACSSR